MIKVPSYSPLSFYIFINKCERTRCERRTAVNSRGGNLAPRLGAIASGHEFPDSLENAADGPDRCESLQLHRGTITGWHVFAVRRRGFFCTLRFRWRRTPYEGSSFRGTKQRDIETRRQKREGKKARVSLRLNPIHFEIVVYSRKL